MFLGTFGRMPTATGFYVYAHVDREGRVFYIGKGSGKRAWQRGRGPLWERYVAERSEGQYTVEILLDGLSEAAAEAAEEFLIAKNGSTLVNWINPGRQFDHQALELFHDLRDANRRLYLPGASDTRELEATNPEEAIRRYRLAISQMPAYARMVIEPTGLVAEFSPQGCYDEPYVIDRLTLCLAKLGRAAEAIADAESYFEMFPESQASSAAKRTIKRIEKLRNKNTA